MTQKAQQKSVWLITWLNVFEYACTSYTQINNIHSHQYNGESSGSDAEQHLS